MRKVIDTRIERTAETARRALPVVAAVAGMLIGSLALMGNVFHAEPLRNLGFPNQGYVRVNTAICLLLASASLLLLKRPQRLFRTLSATCSATVAVVAFLTLVEWLCRKNAGIDIMMLQQAIGYGLPGRMSMNAAVGFLLIASSMLTGLVFKGKTTSQSCAFLAITTSGLAIAGGALGLPVLESFGASTLVAVPTSIGQLLIAGALFLAYPQEGYLELLSSQGLAGVLTRRLLPAMALFPMIAFGIVVLSGIAHWSDTELIAVTVLNCLGLPAAAGLAAKAVHRLEQERKQSEEVLGLKSEFLATMSHEIRTPMNGILGMSEMLLKSGLNSKQLRYTAIIKESAMALLEVINEVLDITKIEAGKLSLQLEDFEPLRLVDGVVQLLCPRALQKGLALASVVDAQLPSVLHGDAGRLRQILINLIGNAIKYSEHGEVTVRLDMLRRDSESVQLKCSVIDCGIGMSAEQIANSFKPFPQTAASANGDDSTGLGLSICKKLIDLMNGQISVESVQGKGSTFWFIVTLGVGTKSTEKPISSEVYAASPARRRSELLLVVEDHLVNQEVAVLLLNDLGFDAHIANNGREALRLIQHFPYALVLMDCQMPDIDGFDATRILRQQEKQTGKHLPVIAMTAYATQGSGERCRQAGMDDFITKPIKPQALQTVLSKWLGQPLYGEPGSNQQAWPMDLPALEAAIGMERSYRLCRMFLQDAAEQLQNIRELLSKRNGEELMKAAHGLRGDCQAVYSTRMVALLVKLETAAQAADWQAAEELVAALDDAYHAFETQFEGMNRRFSEAS